VPLEVRSLYLPGCPVPQGQLELWCDLLPLSSGGPPTARHVDARAALALAPPPVALSGPPPKQFELRVCVWRAEGVPKKAGVDLYAKLHMQLPEVGLRGERTLQGGTQRPNPASPR
jgi:hypothetical protein